jgi:hypothetical protein
VREGIVPVQLIFAWIARLAVFGSGWKIGEVRRGVGAGHFVAIALDNPQLKVEMLLHTQDDILIENEHTLCPTKQIAGRDIDQCGAAYDWEALGQAIDERLICLWRGERLRHEPVPGLP